MCIPKASIHAGMEEKGDSAGVDFRAPFVTAILRCIRSEVLAVSYSVNSKVGFDRQV